MIILHWRICAAQTVTNTVLFGHVDTNAHPGTTNAWNTLGVIRRRQDRTADSFLFKRQSPSELES